MPGPAPKLKEQRRHAHKPARGDWTFLPVKVSHKLPPLPRRKEAWSPFAKRAWEAWWKDPASTQWDENQRHEVEAMLFLTDDWFRERKVAQAAEMRQRQDGLGLTLKGKQDRRWRVVEEEAVPVVSEDVPVLAEYRSMIHGG